MLNSVMKWTAMFSSDREHLRYPFHQAHPNFRMRRREQSKIAMAKPTPVVEEDTDSGEPCRSPSSSEGDARVLRKCDFHVLPMLYVFYALSYLDRINIGNARIEGLERDLGMAHNDYNVALQVFFIPYILLEVPSNILLKRIRPSTWLSFLMFMWGTLDFRI